MKIVLTSLRFSPDLGGIETASGLLAAEFARAGHEVRVITQTKAADGIVWPFSVVRDPGNRELVAHARWCEVFFQNNISLQSLWAPMFLRRPCVVSVQTWIARPDGKLGWRNVVKRAALRLTTNVSISKAVATDIGVRSTLIPNPYRDEIFRIQADTVRDLDLVFLGRLVSDKGVDLLLRALAQLANEGLRPSLSIIGEGPEEARLRKLGTELGLAERVIFHGGVVGDELVALLNRHRVMVVPSLWAEPFGIVALEGIACGCVIVGSSAGGLSDAIGGCGLTFPNGDVAVLASCLQRVLSEPALLEDLRKGSAEHLARHSSRAVASAYLEVFARACSR